MAEGNILMGVVGKPHGVRGLLRVHSFTADPADLVAYAPLVDERGRGWSLAWRGAEGVAELRDAQGRAVADRTEAEKLVNLRLYAARDRLPPTGPDEFYLADLVGLLAVDAAGASLGQVAAVHDFGAGTMLEVGAGPAAFYVPFTRAVVPVVDVPGGQVVIVRPAEIEARAPETAETLAGQGAA